MSRTKIDERIDSLVSRLLGEVRVKLKKGLEEIMNEEREELLKENDWDKGRRYYERSVKSELCGAVEIRVSRTRISEFRSRILGNKWERGAFVDGVILRKLKADEARGNVENAEISIVMGIEEQNEGFMERKVSNREMIAEMEKRLENEGKEEG